VASSLKQSKNIQVYGAELILMIVSTLCCSLAGNFAHGNSGVVGLVVFWRLALGVGIGGDYPVSATVASEYSNVKHRGRIISMVFAMQGVGIFVAAITTVVTLLCFKAAIIADPLAVDYVWRILFVSFFTYNF
jgi:PHS family inorganic phosphate transporter-like MFS transporter